MTTIHRPASPNGAARNDNEATELRDGGAVVVVAGRTSRRGRRLPSAPPASVAAFLLLLLSNAYFNLRWLQNAASSSSLSSLHSGPTAAFDDAPLRSEGRLGGRGGDSESARGSSVVVTVPDWRHAIDCSAWDNMCTAEYRLSPIDGARYGQYPFPLGRHAKHLEDFDHVPLSDVPAEWWEALDGGAKDWTSDEGEGGVSPPRRKVEYIYPPRSSAKERDECLRRSKTESWQDQIDLLLNSGRIEKERETDMVAFTISDYNYARDMMHDVFEMNSEVVGFGGSFFMVALDRRTLGLACDYGYPVVSWPSAVEANDNEKAAGEDKPGGKESKKEKLKSAVANTKFEVSLHLVRKGASFLFYEMDVWFLRSPRDLIAEYHRGAGSDRRDILASSHMNDQLAVNIGVYSVTANESTAEYFELCVQMAKESPGTHDQWIMGQLLTLAWTINANGAPGIKFERMWRPPPKSNPPNMTRPVRYGLYGTMEVMAGERPYPTRNTVAIHTLCEGPMRKPGGKKMMAKELGAWTGFTGRAGGASDIVKADGAEEVAGYYARSGRHRRYLWMDGHDSPGAYNTLQSFEWDVMDSESYIVEHAPSLRWTMTILLALARRTGRIFVLPRIVGREGAHFLWTTMDLESVEDMGVDYRETNFPHNRKSWAARGEPYGSVARTALAPLTDADGEGTMYVQYPADDDDASGSPREGTIESWKFLNGTSDGTALDAWWALHAAIPQVDSAELLLVNPHFVSAPYVQKLMQKMKDPNYKPSVAEREIFWVHRRLRWCPGKIDKEIVMGRSSAEMSCHGRGFPWHAISG